MPRVVHFEIASKVPDKAAAFYHEVFGWNIVKWDGPEEYWMVETGAEEEPGINGGMFRPNNIFSGTVNTIDVPDVDVYIEKIKASGGEIVVEKHAIPNVGYSAYARDVSGTLFGIHQEDSRAT
jgi:predicted enzyme related to lactoylglutathione lyase